MANNNNNKTQKALRLAQMITGTRMHFPNGNEAVMLDGASTTIDAVVAKLQGFVDKRAKVVAAQTVVRNLVEAEDAALPDLNATVTAFTGWIKGQLGSQSSQLADFGVPLRKKPASKTAEEKAIAAAKAQATRAARGTKGPKARQEIKGNVTAKLVVTPATPEAPAPATAASASAPKA